MPVAPRTERRTAQEAPETERRTAAEEVPRTALAAGETPHTVLAEGRHIAAAAEAVGCTLAEGRDCRSEDTALAEVAAGNNPAVAVDTGQEEDTGPAAEVEDTAGHSLAGVALWSCQSPLLRRRGCDEVLTAIRRPISGVRHDAASVVLRFQALSYGYSEAIRAATCGARLTMI